MKFNSLFQVWGSEGYATKLNHMASVHTPGQVTILRPVQPGQMTLSTEISHAEALHLPHHQIPLFETQFAFGIPCTPISS
jgi:hypothetical protein